VIQTASGKSVTLTDGTTHRRSTVIVSTAQLEKNAIKVATKKHKDKLLYKRENIKETDIYRAGAAHGLGPPLGAVKSRRIDTWKRVSGTAAAGLI
jgi:hypothetical protein